MPAFQESDRILLDIMQAVVLKSLKSAASVGERVLGPPLITAAAQGFSAHILPVSQAFGLPPWIIVSFIAPFSLLLGICFYGLTKLGPWDNSSRSVKNNLILLAATASTFLCCLVGSLVIAVWSKSEGTAYAASLIYRLSTLFPLALLIANSVVLCCKNTGAPTPESVRISEASQAEQGLLAPTPTLAYGSMNSAPSAALGPA